MAVLLPVYWHYYGPTNFLYACDLALILTLIGIWTESALLVSMCLVGIGAIQALWVIDYFGNLVGLKITGITDYMFVSQHSIFLRGLSFFHGWLPFLLVFLVWRLGYDRRALVAWTLLAWVLSLIAFFLLPAAGAPETFSNMPRNVDYVFGTDDAKPQALLEPHLYLVVWMLGLFL